MEPQVQNPQGLTVTGLVTPSSSPLLKNTIPLDILRIRMNHPAVVPER